MVPYAQRVSYYPDLTSHFVDLLDNNPPQALVMATTVLSKNDRLLDAKRVRVVIYI